MESEHTTTPTQIDLDRISTHLNLDQETIKVVQDLITQYKQKQGPMHAIKIPYSITCAVLTAWKCQTIASIEEEKETTQNLSVMELIKCLNTITNDTFDLELFITELKQFINVVPLPIQITEKLKGIVNQFAFSYTFFLKYQTLFNTLDVQNTGSEHGGYVAALKNFGWLLYINAKSDILTNETGVVEAVFLLMSTLIHAVYHTPTHVTISYFEKLGKNIYENGFQKKNEKAVQEAVTELWPLIKESKDEITLYSQKLEKFIQKAHEEKHLSFDDKIGYGAIYEAKTLYKNLDQLENHYQEQLGQDDLDERFYLYNCRNTSKQANFTPFAKQGSFNKNGLSSNNQPATPPSHMMNLTQRPSFLNLEISEKINMGLNLKEIKHSNQTVPASPFPHNAALASATPMTKVLELYNWLNEKVKIKKNEANFPLGLDRCLSIFGEGSRDQIHPRLDSILGSEKADGTPTGLSKHLKGKRFQVVNLYLTVLEVVLGKEEKKGNKQQIPEILRNENFHKALITASIETVFFVNNYSGIPFVQLLQECGIQAFEFWRITNTFLNFDPKMPQPIKKHFQDLEFQIVMNLAWKKDSIVHQLINKFMDQMRTVPTQQTEETPSSSPKTVILTHPQELFFKRVLHYTATQISNMCELLGLEEVMAEHVWTAMKHVIGSEGHLLINRHLNQFILCCVYGVNKVFNIHLKFQEIINKYQDLPRFNKDDFAEVIHHVYIDENTEYDLIKFYNNVFITPMKSFLHSLSNNRALAETRASNTPLIKSLNSPAVMQSPLRNYLNNNKGMTPSQPQKVGLTPQTKALHAFGESPYSIVDSINKVLGKRPVDFVDSPKVVLADVGNILKKYVKHSDPLLDKMFEEDSTKSNTNTMITETTNTEPCKGALPSKRNLFGTNPNKAAAK